MTASNHAITGPTAPLPERIGIHHGFIRQAREHPDAIALLWEDQQLTYQELDRKTTRLARFLHRREVPRGALVGVCMSRSSRVVVALLSILKAGCAYVPLDPAYPPERLSDMVADSQCPVILIDDHLRERFSGVSATLLALDDDLAWQSDDLPPLGDEPVDPGSLAYVIYTSGSTGRPKGVCCHHRGVLNLLSDFQGRKALGVGDVGSWWTSLNFDVSVYEIFSPLLVGATLMVVPESVRAEADRFIEWLHTHGVTSAYIPPFMVADLSAWLQANPGKSPLRRLLTGVEPIPERTLRAIDAAVVDLHVINGYGPTEATVCATLYPINRDSVLHENAPIGRPVQNMYAYLLDEDGRPVEAGTEGELHIGGVGVAGGYLNRPELTAERFLPDPFAGPSDAFMYRTGDMVRLLEDGNLEFIGRKDFQVKHRGFRMELGEIETRLRGVKGVREAVVLLRQDQPGHEQLVAYLVLEPEATVVAGGLRKALQHYLPDYMVPSAYVLVAQMPTTPNGKTDRRALPPPDSVNQLPGASAAYRAPRTAIETALGEFFQEVLGAVRVGLDDNFFELGGHSLLATQVMSRLRTAFAVDLPVGTLFKAPTLEALAAEVEALTRQTEPLHLPPLVPSEERSDPPLSFSQLRVWYLDQLEPGTPAYNISLAYRMKGPLSIPVLERSFTELVKRHQSLRTTFVTRRGSPVPIIAEAQPVAVETIDLRHLAEGSREEEAHRLCGEDCQRGFDLRTGPLFRVLLIKLDAEDHVLMLTVHHIVSDGWSMGVALRDLMAFYDGFLTGKPAGLPALPLEYTDFARWQRRWMEGDLIRGQVEYWRDGFRELPEPLNLPTDRRRPAIQSYRGASRAVWIEQPLCERMAALSKEAGTTLFMTLLACFQTLLHRYTHQGDLCVGTFIANRNRLEIENLVGFFINTLALRTDLSDNPPFQVLLQRVKETALGAYAHQDLPFERVLEEINPVRDLSRTPIFQTMMVLQNMPLPPLHLPGVACSPAPLPTFRSNFDLTLWLYESGREIKAVIEYSTHLFEAATIARMLDHFKNLLNDAVIHPAKHLSELALLSPGEKRALLEEGSGARGRLPMEEAPADILRLFREQAARMPEKAALVMIVDGDAPFPEITYGELDERSNRLAGWLTGQGVEPDSLVAVLMDRSPELIVALLGVLKSGAAYVPIDPHYPLERMAYLIGDSGSRLILTDRSNLPRACQLVRESKPEILCVDRDWERVAAVEESEPLPSPGPENLAYVIYTSGSTGQPKGVLIEHRALASFVRSALEGYGIGAGDRVLQFASVSFDASIEEIFPALCSGATLVLRSEAMIRSLPAFLQACRTARITVLDLPTGFWHQLVAVMEHDSLPLPPSVRLVIIGGEQALADRVAVWLETVGREVRLVNTYGPTEATVVATSVDLGGLGDFRPSDGCVPIGKPLPHLKTLVLDPHGQMVPVGVTGELYLGGPSLARGYLNLPDRTAKSFVPDPFSRGPSARLYRTGDLVRFLPDGNLEFLGRADRQVKIRGFRVELAEIEAALSRLSAVKESVVIARDHGPGSLQLVAYIVPQTAADDYAAVLREGLTGVLPDFMIPSFFVVIDKIPLTASGKIDSGALPEPEEKSEAGYVPPRNPVEETLAQIWSDLFGIQRVGVRDNFFDLGGHSLLSLHLIDRINKAGLWLTPVQFMQHPTIEELARVITTARHGGHSELWSCLVDLQPEGHRAPLYLIHSTPGDVLGYMHLINRLGRDQPCYGFQSLGLSDLRLAHRTVMDMAAYYLQEMIAFQPEGPYFLAGWCYGGIVAAEMAVQLCRMGKRIGLLVLIETPFPRTDAGHWRYYVEKAMGLARLGPRGWLRYLRNRFKYWQKEQGGEIDRLFSLELDGGPLANRTQIYQCNREAMRRYRMVGRPYCPIRLINGDELEEGYIPDPQRLWLKQSLDVREFVAPGNHLSILKEPGVKVLAEKLREWLPG